MLEELSPSDAAEILRSLSRVEAAKLLEEIDPDDAADVVEQLPEGEAREAREILVQMRPEEANELRDLSTYEADSAGGIMTPAYVAVTADATADEAIVAIRRLVDEAETANYIYVVDAERKLLGALSCAMRYGARSGLAHQFSPDEDSRWRPKAQQA